MGDLTSPLTVAYEAERIRELEHDLKESQENENNLKIRYYALLSEVGKDVGSHTISELEKTIEDHKETIEKLKAQFAQHSQSTVVQSDDTENLLTQITKYKNKKTYLKTQLQEVTEKKDRYKAKLSKLSQRLIKERQSFDSELSLLNDQTKDNIQSIRAIYEKSQSKLEAKVENLQMLIKAKQDNVDYDSIRKFKDKANEHITRLVNQFNIKTFELRRAKDQAEERALRYKRQIDSSMSRNSPFGTPRNSTQVLEQSNYAKSISISDVMLTTPRHKQTMSMALPAVQQQSKEPVPLSDIADISQKVIDFDHFFISPLSDS